MHNINYLKLITCFVLIFHPVNKAFADNKNVIALYDSVMVLISQNQQEQTIPLLQRIVSTKPDFKDAYDRFSGYCFYYQKTKLLIQTTQELIDKYPHNGLYYLDLSTAFFQEDEIDQAEQILESQEFQRSNYSKTRNYLLHSKICFNKKLDSAGQTYYEFALSKIKSYADNEIIFKDIIYIISDDEYSDYDSTALSEMPNFYHAFWKRRDPTPATKLNERIPEHFRRLFYAGKHYRKFTTQTNLDNPLLYENNAIGSSALSFMGFNPFEKLNLPGGMIAQKELDDQGCIYVRHGQPDDSEMALLEGNDAFCVYWLYYARGKQPSVIYYFLLRKGSYRLLAYPLSRKNLEYLDARFWKADLWRLQSLCEENKIVIEEHTHLETIKHDYGGKPLEFPFSFIDLKAANRHNTIECYYGIPLKKFKPNKDEPTAPIEIEKSITVFDKNWLKIDNWQHTDKFATDERNKGWKDILYLNQRHFTLKPGVYNFALQVRDPHSKKIGLYKIPLKVKDYHTDSLQISSVLLATNLSPETPQSLFAKDGVQFTPKFNREFKRNKPVGMYYEVYNLSYNSEGQTDYEMNYSVWRYKKPEEIDNPKNKKPVISTGVKQSGRKRDEKVWMSFDMSDHKKGKYVIEILVRDKLTGERVRKLIPVELK